MILDNDDENLIDSEVSVIFYSKFQRPDSFLRVPVCKDICSRLVIRTKGCCDRRFLLDADLGNKF